MRNVVDLYSGVGGLSLGAARAGFNVVGAVELDPIALDAHAANFPQTEHLRVDVEDLTGDALLKSVGLKAGDLDGLIGGPPCQGFSAIGRQRPDDSRNNLFYHFFRLVHELQPKFFVAENVPGIMDEKHATIRDSALGLVANNYAIIDPLRVVATNYGAPTTRTRYFFIGIHRLALPQHLGTAAFDFKSQWLRPAPNVKTALKGLPLSIRSDWLTDPQGWRKATIPEDPRHTHFFQRVTGMIPPNVGDPVSIDRYFRDGLVSGCMGTRHSPEVKRRYKELKHGSRDAISRSIKLDPNGYCPTLRAGTGSERGSYQAVRPIHPSSARVITPREAARLQGFPDWFRFHETKWHSFRQIGNSVSPVVAEAILKEIHSKLFAPHSIPTVEEANSRLEMDELAPFPL